MLLVFADVFEHVISSRFGDVPSTVLEKMF